MGSMQHVVFWDGRHAIQVDGELGTIARWDQPALWPFKASTGEAPVKFIALGPSWDLVLKPVVYHVIETRDVKRVAEADYGQVLM